MKRVILVVLCLLLASVNVYAAELAIGRSVTSNSVSFNTTGLVITFNSVTSSISIENESSSVDTAYIELESKHLGWNEDKTAYFLPDTTPGTVRLKPGDTLNVDFATDQIGVRCKVVNGTITYVAISDKIDI